MKYTVRPKRRKIAASSVTPSTRRRILAADDDNDDLFGPIDEDSVNDADFQDTLDDVADTVDDIQDAVDEVDQDDVDIETDNNISGHYIAECDGCHGVFITAVLESDQPIERISGKCPLCDKETDQYLKWVIHDVDDQPEDTNGRI